MDLMSIVPSATPEPEALPDNLNGIRARVDDATPEPWLVADGPDGKPVVYVETDTGIRVLFHSAASEADAQFVCTARHRMPQLVAEVERLRAEAASVRAAVLDEVMGRLDRLTRKQQRIAVNLAASDSRLDREGARAVGLSRAAAEVRGMAAASAAQSGGAS